MRKIGGILVVFAAILFLSFGCGCINQLVDVADELEDIVDEAHSDGLVDDLEDVYDRHEVDEVVSDIADIIDNTADVVDSTVDMIDNVVEEEIPALVVTPKPVVKPEPKMDWEIASEIPAGYYSETEISMDILESFEWDMGVYYEKNGFDCSQMSAFLERYFESYGEDVDIIEGRTLIDGNWLRHAWIERDGFGYESTTKKYIYHPENYQETARYEDIYELRKVWKRDGDLIAFLYEWAWWNN